MASLGFCHSSLCGVGVGKGVGATGDVLVGLAVGVIVAVGLGVCVAGATGVNVAVNVAVRVGGNVGVICTISGVAARVACTDSNV